MIEGGLTDRRPVDRLTRTQQHNAAADHNTAENARKKYQAGVRRVWVVGSKKRGASKTTPLTAGRWR